MNIDYSALAVKDHVALDLTYPSDKDLIIYFQNIFGENYYVRENINGENHKINAFKKDDGLKLVNDIRQKAGLIPLPA